MMESIRNLTRSAKRRLTRVIRKAKDPEEARRATAILNLHHTGCVAQVASMVAAARSSIYRWISWFEADDVGGLKTQQTGRPTSTVTPEVITLLSYLLESTPEKYGYIRTRWSSELLAKEIQNLLDVPIHASTVRRLLPSLGYRYRRARPFLFRRDPRKAEKLARIDEVLKLKGPNVAVFYVDEVDINLNPKIGFGWRPVGKQEHVPTPGQNRKYYIAGALNAHTGKVVWTESKSKNSDLFISLLRALRMTYRRSERIILIMDNVNTHSSRKTTAFLRRNPKIECVFQPVYHPWVNRIERLWKSLHDTVTRNHRYKDLDEMRESVSRFLEVVQPFPGSKPCLAEAVL